MKKRYLVAFLFLIPGPVLFAQQAFNKEISFTIENDAFLFNKKDAYYTNGLFLKQTQAVTTRKLKKLRSLELGQMLYTPLDRLTQSAKGIDRPYCGYLFMKMNELVFTKEEEVWQYGASLGAVGAASFGEDMQHWYHKMLGYGQFRGWSYQVQTAIDLDLSASYARTVLEDSSWIKFVPVAELALGSTFTNAKIGAYTCLGKFAGNQHSALWTARVQERGGAEHPKTELFFYWYPQIIWQGYNATVEGGLFSKSDSTAALGTTSRWMFQQAWGVCFAKGRWTTKLAFVYQTREAVAQTNVQRYGSIQLGYRLR